MSPLIQKNSNFSLGEIERIKLELTWIAANEPQRLNEQGVRDLIRDVWLQDLKKEISSYFRGFPIEFKTIVDAFNTMYLTTNPKIFTQYDAETDRLEQDLIGLFYQSGSEPNFVTPTFAWKTASQMVHEFDHYQYLHESGMTGRGEKQDKFKEENSIAIEKRAYERQIVFLRNCVSNVPQRSLIYDIRVIEWGESGRKFRYQMKVQQVESSGIVQAINTAIEICGDVKDHKLGKNYDSSCDENNLKIQQEIMQALCIQTTSETNIIVPLKL